MSDAGPDIERIKGRMKVVWMAGDYGHLARSLEAGADEFLKRLNISPGTRLLDVGCGSGQTAIPAARLGAVATGIDIAPNLIAQARARASDEGLKVQFDEGDAEAMPYADSSFDVVVSLIGAMFAPRPERATAEMIRVCAPGGRIVMGNWTREGFVGQMFLTIGKHFPPPPDVPSPLLWGDEGVVRERFKVGVSELRLRKYQYPFHFSFPPKDVVEHFRSYFGPANRAFAALSASAQEALRSDLLQLWTRYNTATDGSTQYQSEYLEVVAVKA